MKKSLLVFIITFTILFSCSREKAPVIGMNMSYWEGKYSINKSYVDAIRENGGRVRLIPCTDDIDLLREEIKDVDGFVFIGGSDYMPEWYGKEMHHSIVLMDLHRASFDTLFMNMAFDAGKPILGICAGEQLMVIATGGKLIRDISGHRGVEHKIHTVKGSMINELFGDSLLVNSWHHQCVEPENLNKNFTVTAWSPDSIVECIEWQGDPWMLGTQFHPERMPKEQRDMLIRFFLNQCRK